MYQPAIDEVLEEVNKPRASSMRYSWEGCTARKILVLEFVQYVKRI
jgi:hypothetical protein